MCGQRHSSAASFPFLLRTHAHFLDSYLNHIAGYSNISARDFGCLPLALPARPLPQNPFSPVPKTAWSTLAQVWAVMCPTPATFKAVAANKQKTVVVQRQQRQNSKALNRLSWHTSFSNREGYKIPEILSWQRANGKNVMHESHFQIPFSILKPWIVFLTWLKA